MQGIHNPLFGLSRIEPRRVINIFEPVHEISNKKMNVVCSTSKDSGQTAHTRSLLRAFASRLSIL